MHFFFTVLFFIAHNKTSPDTTKTVNLLLVCGLSAQTGQLLSRPHVYFREKQQAAASRLRGGANVATQWQIPTSPLDRDQQAKHLGDFLPSGGRNYCSVAFHIFIGTPAFLLSLASCPPFPLVPGSWGSQSIQGFCHFKKLRPPPPCFLGLISCSQWATTGCSSVLVSEIIEYSKSNPIKSDQNRNWIHSTLSCDGRKHKK